MFSLDSLVASIDWRLDELRAEIDQLQTARAALESSRVAAVNARDGTIRSRSRSRRVRPAGPVQRPATSPANEDPTGRERAPQARGARGSRPARNGARRSAVGSLRPEDLEQILSAEAAGLSAGVIAERAGVGYQAMLRLLRELEASGRVRREGSRRSTRWRLLSDEDRIAERAAELELLAASRS